MEKVIIHMPEYWQHLETFSQRLLKQIEIEIPAYTSSYGVIPVGSDESSILDVQVMGGSSQEVMITADKEGLILLARHLLTFAQDDVPLGCHMVLSTHFLLSSERARAIRSSRPRTIVHSPERGESRGPERHIIRYRRDYSKRTRRSLKCWTFGTFPVVSIVNPSFRKHPA